MTGLERKIINTFDQPLCTALESISAIRNKEITKNPNISIEQKALIVIEKINEVRDWIKLIESHDREQHQYD